MGNHDPPDRARVMQVISSIEVEIENLHMKYGSQGPARSTLAMHLALLRRLVAAEAAEANARSAVEPKREFDVRTYLVLEMYAERMIELIKFVGTQFYILPRMRRRNKWHRASIWAERSRGCVGRLV